MSKTPRLPHRFDERTRRRWRRQRLPNILVTNGASPMAQALVKVQTEDCNLILFDNASIEETEDVRAVEGSLLSEDDVWMAVRGIDAVVHIALPPVDLPADSLDREHHLLDLAGCGTHTLFTSAVSAGVKRFVIISTLDVFRPYPADVYISEERKPLPDLDINRTASHLAEGVAREFARDNAISVTCLRIGNLTSGEDDVADPSDHLAVDLRDAAQAVAKALERDASGNLNWSRRWALYHIAADLPNPRYLINEAKRGLRYEPANGSETKGEA